jgi:hypothetical protein
MKATIIVVLAVLALTLAACGGSSQSDQSAKIGKEIGGDCTATNYLIVYKAEKRQARIYDCWVNTKRLCVTEENGIPSDQTATARLVYADALGGKKPACLSR